MIHIPDNIYKIIIAIGLIALAFGYLALEENKKKYNESTRELQLQRDAVKETIGNLNVSKTKYYKMADRLSKKYELPNPLQAKDTAAVAALLSGGGAPVNDSLFSLYLLHQEETGLLNIQQRKLTVLRTYLQEASDEHDSNLFRLKLIGYAGLIFFFIGLMGLTEQESDEDRLKYYHPNGQKKYYDRCQSCAKKFSAMITCGTQEDGSYNSAFCHACFDKGKFTEPELTKEEMWKRVKAATRNVKGLSVRKRMIDKLDRWKANLYN